MTASFADHPSVRAVRTMLERTSLGLSESRGADRAEFEIRTAEALAAQIQIEKTPDGRIRCTVLDRSGTAAPDVRRWSYRDSRSEKLEPEDIRAIRGAYDAIGRIVARLTAVPEAAAPDPVALAGRIRAVIDHGGEDAATMVAETIASVVDADKAGKIMDALATIVPPKRTP